MNTTETNRRLENIIRIGTIAELDYTKRTLRVSTGDLLTANLAWPAEIGKNYICWKPLRKGTQVVLACPSGDLGQAKIIAALYTQAIASPSSEEALDIIKFNDGTVLQYDSENKKLTAECAGDVALSAVGNVQVEAQGNIELKTQATVTLDCTEALVKGKLTVEKDIQCNAKITASTDVVAATTSLVKHKHLTPHGLSGPALP